MLPASTQPRIDPEKAIQSILKLQCSSSNVNAHGGIFAGDAWFSDDKKLAPTKQAHVNSWVSMFSSQAIAMYIYGSSNPYNIV